MFILYSFGFPLGVGDSYVSQLVWVGIVVYLKVKLWVSTRAEEKASLTLLPGTHLENIAHRILLSEGQLHPVERQIQCALRTYPQQNGRKMDILFCQPLVNTVS